MSSPGLSSSDAATSVPGSGSRGSSAAADATTIRAWPVASAVQGTGAGRRHVEVRQQAAIGVDFR